MILCIETIRGREPMVINHNQGNKAISQKCMYPNYHKRGIEEQQIITIIRD